MKNIKTMFDRINVVAGSPCLIARRPRNYNVLRQFLISQSLNLLISAFLITSVPIILTNLYAGNLLTNWNFETGNTSGWTTGGTASFNVDTSTAIGTTSARIGMTTATGKKVYYQNVPSTPTWRYNLAGYVWDNDANISYIGFLIKPNGGSAATSPAPSVSNSTTTAVNSNAWQFLSMSTTTESGYTFFGVNAIINFLAGASTGYFDNIYFGLPDTPSSLIQLNNSGSQLAQGEWTTSTIIISSFTQAGSVSGSGPTDAVKFHLQVTSGSAASPDWSTLFVDYTSGLISEGTTGYQWPTLTGTATYWWRVWTEDKYNGVTGATSTISVFCFSAAANQAPFDVSGLTQLAGTTILPSMAWTTSSVIISSFTLNDPDTSEQLKFYLHITSVTTGGDAADWSQLFHASTSGYLAEGTTQYNWPTLTNKATYWWRVWCEDDSGASSVSTTTFLADDNTKTAKFGYTPPPNAPSGLTQLNGYGTQLVSMQWSTSTVVISSFTQSSPLAGDLKFHLQVSSFTGFSPLLFETTSQLIAQGTTGYQWPALTDYGTYWWRVWSEDSNGFTSSTSTALGVGGDAKLGIDPYPPAAITDLGVVLNSFMTGEIKITWTAPKNSGAGGDKVTEYDLRYATWSFTDSDWNHSSVTQYAGEPTPSVPGTLETAYLNGGLPLGTTYYFHIKSSDTFDPSAIDNGTVAQVLEQHIVISEVMIATTSTSGEYVELYNPTTVQFDLNALGLKLHIINGAGTDGNAAITFINNSIPSKGYFLIAGTGTLSDIWPSSVNPDATYATSSNNLVAGGDVYISTYTTLYSTGAIDLLGLDNVGGWWEGTAFGSNPTAGQSAERKANSGSSAATMAIGGADEFSGNGYDTNDNSSDFVSRTTGAQPQNSTSDTEPSSDTTPPAAISDLTALAGSGNNLGIVKLSWTSPGDDGVTGNLTGLFRINYSSVGIITANNFVTASSTFATVVDISTTSLTPLTACTTTFYNLNRGTTYWFAIKTADDVNNWSVWNSTADTPFTQNTSAYCFLNSSPSAPGTLQQLNNSGTVLTSMQWTNSSTIISSFTLSDAQSWDTVKFYLHITSVTSGTSADWTQSWHASTSSFLAQGTTGYQWPTLTNPGTYWWRVWAEDDDSATSSTSTILGVGGDAKLGFDNTAPDAVTNLTALAGWKVDTVVLKWTAPNANPGPASSYLMRYSTTSFTNSEWDAAWVKNLNTKATIPAPSTTGTTELMLITGLTNGTSYWFAIKSQDAIGNTSAINSNTQDFAVAQTTNPLVINEIAPWQTSGIDGAEFYIKNPCYAGGLKLYGKDDTGSPAIEVVKTLPSAGGVWEEEIPAGTYIIIYMRTAGTDETTVGQSLSNALKVYAGATIPDDTSGLINSDGYCILTDTAGITTSANIIQSGEILDFVAYQNQDQTGFADTYDDDNVNYAISKGHWLSTCTTTCGFDCVNSRRNGNSSSIARNNSSSKTYNSKYDWTYRYQSISTGTANGTIDPTSGGGVCTVTPGTAQISTAGTWKFKYNGNSSDSVNHTVVLQIPSSWPEPQNTDSALANYTTAFISTLSDPPNPGDAGFTSGYGVTISQIIGTNAGWNVVVAVGDMAAADNLYIVYGATYASTNGVVTAPATSGTYTFRVYSDTNGVNVSEIASSPQVTVAEAVPPAAISDLTALEGTDDGIVKLNWTSPGDDGVSSDLTGTFRIKYSSVSIISSGNFDSPPSNLAVTTVNISTTALTPLTACTTTMYGLNAGTSYFFAIKTADDVNNWSVWNSSANELTVNTSAYCAANDQVPPAPTNLVATAGNQQVTLTWDAVTSEPDLDFYRIYCDSKPPVAVEWYVVGTTPAANTSYLHTGLTNNSTYNYRITVVDLGDSTSGYSTVNESAYSNEYSTYPTTVPLKAALVYFSTGTTATAPQIPSFRKWNGTTFNGEESSVNMGGAVDLYTVVRMCPQSVREETIVGVLDRSDASTSPDINISTYTAANGWGTAQELSTDSDVTTVRCFDIAYEQTSGDYLVVARTNNSTSVPWYSVNGAAMTAGPTHGAGTIQWVRLKPKPNSDEIILVTVDSNNDVYASVWNGTAFGNTQLLEDGSVSSSQGFDVAYTQSAGVGFVVWVDATSTRPQYRTWDGYSWSAETTTVHDHFSGTTGSNIKLAANPKNNELMLGTNDNGDDINVEVWSSTLSVWLNGKEIDATAKAQTIRTFDVAYEKSSGDGLLVYADAAGGIPVVWTWNAGGSGGWAAGTNANDTAAATLNWVQLASDDQSDKIHLITSDADSDINVQTWSGSAWGSITEVETESSNSEESFFCRFPNTAAPSDIIAPAAVTSLSGLAVATSTGTIKLTWSAPGDDVWLGRLTNGCQYQIYYCTSTENREWYYWTAVSSPTGSDTFAPGTFLTTTVSDLVGDCSYYCKIRYSDGSQWSDWTLCNEATAYASAPILSVDIIETSYNFGEVGLGISSQTQTTIQVKNDGNIIENFGIKCETNTVNSPWYTTGTSTETGSNIFLLKAGFHSTTMPAITSFGNEDIVSTGTYKTSQTQAGGGRFTIDGTAEGVNVGVNATKNLWLRLDMPGTSDTVASQEIILYIRAESP